MSKKVLIVDDSSTVRQQVKSALSTGEFEVLEAVDGLDGLEKLAATGAVALVVCDVNMPRMGGIEFLERVRADATLQALPVVMLTTEGNPEIVHRAKSLNAKGWIVKPAKSEMILAVVRKLAVAA